MQKGLLTASSKYTMRSEETYRKVLEQGGFVNTRSESKSTRAPTSNQGGFVAHDRQPPKRLSTPHALPPPAAPGSIPLVKTDRSSWIPEEHRNKLTELAQLWLHRHISLQVPNPLQSKEYYGILNHAHHHTTTCIAIATHSFTLPSSLWTRLKERAGPFCPSKDIGIEEYTYSDSLSQIATRLSTSEKKYTLLLQSQHYLNLTKDLLLPLKIQEDVFWSLYCSAVAAESVHGRSLSHPRQRVKAICLLPEQLAHE